MGKVSKRSKTDREPSAYDRAAGPPEKMPLVPTPSRGVSSPQLAALAVLSVMISNLMNLGKAVTDGVGSEYCADQYASAPEDGCTAPDAFFVRARYHASVVSTVLTTLVVLLTWSDDGLLQRLVRFLAAGPLAATLVALACSRDYLSEGRAATLALTPVALIAVSVMSGTSAPVPPVRVRFDSVHHGAMFLLLVASLVRVGRCFVGGPEDFSTVEASMISDGARAQMAFLAVERMTVASLLAFGLIYYDDIGKRIMMFAIAMSHLGQVFFQLPLQKEYLRDVDGLNNFLFGTAVGLIALSVLPPQTKKSA